MKKKLRCVLSVLIVVIGVIGLFYPTISNYLNEKNTSRVMQSYDATVAQLNEEQRRKELQAAYEYNQVLLARNGYETPIEDEDGNYISGEGYNDILNISGDGIMGYLVIPKLNETVLIFHGTSESVLQSGIGHIENTSLPVGGNSTHAALSGHRGLPSKQLFTDLDQMAVGDVFFIKILGETLAYQVDQILTVLPTEMEALAIEENKDYVTLVTCTPYAINTHRLLVRGVRIPYEQAERIQEESGQTASPQTQTYKELMLALLVLLIYFAGRFIIGRIKKENIKSRNKVAYCQNSTYEYTVTYAVSFSISKGQC